MQVQIISDEVRPMKTKTGKDFQLQEIQGLTLGANPQVFKAKHFLFDGLRPFVVESGKKYSVETDVEVDRELNFKPVVTGYKLLS